jgi:hypothetical protein
VTPPPERVWRVFPWDPNAPAGARFSPGFVPASQGQGRFDLPGMPGGVLYAAETPEHAVAEMIQHYRGHPLAPADLRVAGHRLALAALTLARRVRERLVDLCDPEGLVRLGVRPDATASNDRRMTQRIAADIHAAQYCGLRWWSALTGDWHTLVLFTDRLAPPPEHGRPQVLELDHPAVIGAARALGMRRA